MGMTRREFVTGAGLLFGLAARRRLGALSDTLDPPMTFVEGGVLELGVIRDSTLNATNDYQAFAEIFEGMPAFATVYAAPVDLDSTMRTGPARVPDPPAGPRVTLAA